MQKSYPAWIEIDRSQFRKNLRAIRERVGQKKICLPVKADAYGHGLCEMAKVAAEEGVNSLGVFSLQEALELRRGGVALPILIFGALHEEEVERLIEQEFEFAISSRYKAELVLKKTRRRDLRYKVHVEIDTGMRRTGVKPESALKLIEWMERQECFEIVGIYSHLATSDQPGDLNTKLQLARFQELQEKLGKRGWIWHIASSGGVAHYPDSFFDMVRPGLLAYGYFPNGGSDPEGKIAPCLSLHAKISFFKVVGAGEGISYGHAYRAKEETRIVTVPVGHGDGYRRSLWNRAEVLIREKRFPIAGAICMDQFMVDIGQGEAYVGDLVTMVGRQGKEEVSLWEIANHADSIPYELLCGLGRRLPRIYTWR